MPVKSVSIALVVGSFSIFLGSSRLLDDLVEGIRNFNTIGTPQPITRPRQAQPVSRFERLCFVAAGATVIAIGILATIFGK
jgi:hypothetical protein